MLTISNDGIPWSPNHNLLTQSSFFSTKVHFEMIICSGSFLWFIYMNASIKHNKLTKRNGMEWNLLSSENLQSKWRVKNTHTNPLWQYSKNDAKKRIIFYTEHLHYTFIKFYDFAKRMREKKGELKAKRDEHQFVIFGVSMSARSSKVR